MGSELLAAIAGPIVTALLAGMGVAFGEWRQRRDLENRRKDVLGLAHQEIEFLEAWLKLYERVGAELGRASVQGQIEGDLIRLHRGVGAAMTLGPVRRRVTLVGVIKTMIFLESRRRSVAGVLFRIFYYPLLIISMAIAVASSVMVAQHFDPADVLTGIFVVAIFSVAPLLFVRFLDHWAVKRDRRA